jgi:hypothetical protein
MLLWLMRFLVNPGLRSILYLYNHVGMDFNREKGFVFVRIVQLIRQKEHHIPIALKDEFLVALPTNVPVPSDFMGLP